MSVRSDVIEQFKIVAAEQDKRLAPLVDDLPLLECGLDSLCFAVIVARLEDTLGVDPFSTAVAQDAEFPVTLREFINLYEKASK
jgi:hypothetical protein